MKKFLSFFVMLAMLLTMSTAFVAYAEDFNYGLLYEYEKSDNVVELTVSFVNNTTDVNLFSAIINLQLDGVVPVKASDKTTTITTGNTEAGLPVTFNSFTSNWTVNVGATANSNYKTADNTYKVTIADKDNGYVVIPKNATTELCKVYFKLSGDSLSSTALTLKNTTLAFNKFHAKVGDATKSIDYTNKTASSTATSNNVPAYFLIKPKTTGSTDIVVADETFDDANEGKLVGADVANKNVVVGDESIEMGESGKVYTFFKKNSTENDLQSLKYGLEVTIGGTKYKFPGQAPVPAGKAWAIKLVVPNGTFENSVSVGAMSDANVYFD